jgi:hypothetical protein
MASQNECNCNPAGELELLMPWDRHDDTKGEDPPGCNAGALAVVEGWCSGASATDWDCSDGTSEVEVSSKIRSAKMYDSEMCFVGYHNTFGFGCAGIQGLKSFELPITSFTTSIGVNFSFSVSADPGSSPAPFQQVHVIRQTLKRGSSVVDQQDGVIGMGSDGSLTRLGLFEDEAFDPEETEDGWEIDVASFEVTASLPSGSGDLTMEVTTRIVALDGNMDREADAEYPAVCYTDRAILHGLLGTSIGDPNYLPEADLNLDGTIDASDMAIFNTIPCSVNWDCSTTSPKFNVSDYNGFMNSFSNSDPVADIDGSGSLNILDYNAFLNAANYGCP